MMSCTAWSPPLEDRQNWGVRTALLETVPMGHFTCQRERLGITGIAIGLPMQVVCCRPGPIMGLQGLFLVTLPIGSGDPKMEPSVPSSLI